MILLVIIIIIIITVTATSKHTPVYGAVLVHGPSLQPLLLVYVG
jgi:hypothetical protein